MAALLLATVVAVAVVAAVVPFKQSETAREELHAVRRLIAETESAQTAALGGTTTSYQEVLLEGESSGILAAALQHHVAELARKNLLSLRSTQVLPPKRDGDLTVIGLEASLQGDIGGLRGLLFALETGAPLLFVEALTVKATLASEAAMRPASLDINLKIHGYGADKEAN